MRFERAQTLIVMVFHFNILFLSYFMRSVHMLVIWLLGCYSQADTNILLLKVQSRTCCKYCVVAVAGSRENLEFGVSVAITVSCCTSEYIASCLSCNARVCYGYIRTLYTFNAHIHFLFLFHCDCSLTIIAIIINSNIIISKCRELHSQHPYFIFLYTWAQKCPHTQTHTENKETHIVDNVCCCYTHIRYRHWARRTLAFFFHFFYI